MLATTESKQRPETGAQQTSPAKAGRQGQRLVVSTIRDPGELERIRSEWSQLAAHASEPNPFYEPWFLLPAMQQFGKNEDWEILLVHAAQSRPGGPAELCGLFPFVRRRGRLRLPYLSLWHHEYCYLTAPLILKGQEQEVFRTVAEHLREDETALCCSLRLLPGDGPVQQSLIEAFRSSLTTTYTADLYLRACVDCPENVDEYFKQSFGGHHWRETGRQRRKLESQGRLEYRLLSDERSISLWTDWFLNLEASGWKAHQGTAMAQNPADAEFFRKMVAQGMQAERLRLEGLFLNGEPIAMKCNLYTPPGCFAFKIAFDESLKKYSPGIQLEIESLRRLSQETPVRWCDSCAIPGHAMINRLWSERRTIQHLLFSTGSLESDIALGTLPLLRVLRRHQRRCTTRLRDLFRTSTATRSP